MLCPECYTDRSRITPLFGPEECLREHTQYICGSCGRCICIERTEKGLQRWNFPFKSLDIARLYLRAADYTMKKCCGIYEIKNGSGRVIYKIFAGPEELAAYLKKKKGKTCESGRPVFSADAYREFPATQVRRLSAAEAERYLSEREG